MRKSHVAVAAVAVLLAAGAVVAATAHDGPTSMHTNTAASRSDAFAEAPVTTVPAFGAALDQRAAEGGSGSLAATSDAATAAPAAAAVAPAQARVVKTASLELSVRTNALVSEATSEANHVVEAQGGYIASSDSFKGRNRQTTLTLRVPAANYDAALRDLRRLGKVTDESLGGKDVTGTLVDLEARLRSLRAQEEALNALMAKARTVGETLQVAQTASEVRMQIEQLAAQQAQLADQADFATIKVHIVGPNVAVDTGPRADPLLVSSLRHAVGGTLAVFGGTLVVLGYALPLGALVALAYGAWRLVNRKRRTEVAVAS